MGKQAEDQRAAAEGAAAAASEAQPAPVEVPVIAPEERAALAEERLAAAMELMTQQGAALAQLLEDRQGAAADPGFASLSQAEALARMQGTVSDRLEGDTLLSDVGEKPVTFVSKGVNFNAVRIGRQRLTASNGEMQVSKGVTYDFAPTGTYTAQTVEAVAFLRNLASFNREFWEVGKEPHSAPDPDVILGNIMEALGDFDDQRLEEIETLEKTSHKREVVLKAVGHARRVVQGVEVPS